MASYKMAGVRRMVIDGHVHMWHKICKTEEFLGKLSKTGVDGSIVISQPPVSFEKGYEYLSFEKRIDNLISFTDKRDLLFPFSLSLMFWLTTKTRVIDYLYVCNGFLH